MAASKLRKKAWDLSTKVSPARTKTASKLGENGSQLVDDIVKMLKGIQYNLGLAEYELEIPGAILHNAFQEGINDVLTQLDSFISRVQLLDEKEGNDMEKKEEEKKRAVEISKAMAHFSNWVDSRTPLVMKKDYSSHISKDKAESLVKILTRTDEEGVPLLVIPITNQDSDGIDKTTLASYAYHDELVYRHFSVRHWVCMTGPRGRRGKLLDQVFRCQTSNNDILNNFHHIVDRKRYLLILDGLTEAVSGMFLQHLLSNVGPGSKILVITSNVAILESMAPLQMDSDPNETERYHGLSSSIQQCLKYCSLFPMKYRYNMTNLIHLWASQEFLAGEGSPEEVVGDKYFCEVLNQGYFFQDQKSDSKGVTVHYKILDNKYGFIKNAAKHDFRLVDKPTDNIDCSSILHLSFCVGPSWEAPQWLFDANHLLSLLLVPKESYDFASISNIDNILSRLKHLRALDLAAVNCGDLPDSLGELQDLRYLRLGCSSESLSGCILKLQKLQTLDLRLSKVRKLPSDFCQLVTLRHLYTGDRLDDMPPNFGQLRSLHTLDVFIVGLNNGLDALVPLNHLCGKLKIYYKKTNALRERVDILKGRNLTDLSFICSSSPDTVADEYEIFQLPSTLKSLEVSGNQGVVFPPRVMDEFSSLQSLESVDIRYCHGCNRFPDFSILPKLKSLRLWNMKSLEYIQHGGDYRTPPSTAAYFPFLEHLTLSNLPKLKGWSSENHQNLQLHFPRLVVLKISSCPNIMSIPGAPWLDLLEVEDIHEKLLNNLLNATKVPSTSSPATSRLKELKITFIRQLQSLKISQSILETLIIRRCPELHTLDVEALSYLQIFEVHECGKSMKITRGEVQLLSIDWKEGKMMVGPSLFQQPSYRAH